METLFGVVIDRGTKVFKITARSTVVATMLGVSPAVHAVDNGEYLAIPPFCRPQHALIEFLFVGLLLAAIFVVD